ncbi:regulation of nuclear pre-mRNA domain-containing protein 1B-like [Impatiens glandulifera]|uniref:regulation of nuclear pre-mRNA domain-containing protein 1B-like n=1 Tax=Impatiens glandulifera TaxID=253017 RepID=UPI001FB08289|nr:regulation of nuclear pre-mRNA domain-containing protein 1B-like [Impatiens glandulifera]
MQDNIQGNMMSDNVFDAQNLSEKLSKLNSSQQSIESLSNWCITYRKKAKEIVEIWDKSFNSAKKERVAFLYLANDILQNSRRKGNEFVNEFWKVLPAALRNVFHSADNNGKKAATRLMDIWEERKVFGSRVQHLKDELLNKDPPPILYNVKSSNPIKTVKKDVHSLRIKLPVGGMPEKIVTAFQSVHDVTEEKALEKCKAAVNSLEKMETLVGSASAEDEMHALEGILQECMKQLHSAEENRSFLVTILKAAIEEQESKLEIVQTYLQAARRNMEQMNNMKQPRLTSPPLSNTNIMQQTTTNSSSSLDQPTVSLAPLKTSEDDNNKSAAAALAAKLASSTSSALMFTSVLSSLVAQESASMSSLKRSPFTSSSPPDKRPKFDTTNSDTAGIFTSLQQQLTNQVQAGFSPNPQPPSTQFLQSPGLMMYPFNNNGPFTSQHMPMGLVRPSPASPQQPQTNNSSGGGYYHPSSGMTALYGQSQPPSTPQVNRQ